MSPVKKYAYVWVTLGLFVLSLAGHWIFGWWAYLDEAHAHHQPVDVNEYTVEMARDTFENWQSEFLQLVWQVGGLMILYAIGSPQSKEGEERLEEKIDFLLQHTPAGPQLINDLDRRLPRR